jgi:hypothetical protein
MKYLSYLLCGLLVLAVVSCQFLLSEQEVQQEAIAPFLNGPTKELFKVYHAIFKKEYDLYSEEGVRRYQNFKASLRLFKEMKEQNPSMNLDDSMDANPEEKMVNENFEETNFSKKICTAQTCGYRGKCTVCEQILKNGKIHKYAACLKEGERCPPKYQNPSMNLDDSMDANPEEKMVNENFEETNYAKKICTAQTCGYRGKCTVCEQILKNGKIHKYAACLKEGERCPPKYQNPSMNLDDSMDANPEEKMVNENFEETNFSNNRNWVYCSGKKICPKGQSCCRVHNAGYWFNACFIKCPK